ncbi:MAG: hypothetical protein Q4G39_09710 [Brachymonas sp.]|nr:hypothetical protein [Brachymonas sp.]
MQHPPLPQDKDYWILDYSWSSRGGKWSEMTDVMLIGEAVDACGAQALAEWVAQQESSDAQVDGQPRSIFYAGGVRGYLNETEDAAPAARTLYLHSSGQDAFDSLSYYSQEIAEFLQARGCKTAMQWAEARHDRRDHQLAWV